MGEHDEKAVESGTASANTDGNTVRRDERGRFVPGSANIWRKGGRPPKSVDDLAEDGARKAIRWATGVLRNRKSSAIDRRHAANILARMGARRVTPKEDAGGSLPPELEAAIRAQLDAIPERYLRAIAVGQLPEPPGKTRAEKDAE